MYTLYPDEVKPHYYHRNYIILS